jgi:hypothetical protein
MPAPLIRPLKFGALDLPSSDTIKFFSLERDHAPCRGVQGGVVMDFPKCQKCNNGLLIPLSDYGQDGASVMYKAWACTNPDCGFSLRVDKGEVTYGKKIEHKH